MPQIDRIAGKPFAFRRVKIWLDGITRHARRITKRAINRAPVFLRHAPHWNGATLPLAWYAVIRIILDGIEKRHDFCRRPALTTRLSPGIKSRRHAANGDLRIDCGRTTQRLAAPIEFWRLSAGAPSHQPWPLPGGLMRGVMHEGHDIGAAQSGRRFGRAPITPGFQQQHATMRIFRKPRCQSSAR